MSTSIVGCAGGGRGNSNTNKKVTEIEFCNYLAECGDMHEYYDQDSGEPINNKGFQSWNLLAYNMCQWLRTNNG